MSEKNIILTARIASMLLTPFYLPVMGILAIFFFSYLSMFPWQFKVSLVVMVYLFTVFIPTVLIHLYRQYQGWTLLQLGQKERRMVPYAISILCYFSCFYLMNLLHLPHLITSILIVALVIQMLCAVINVCVFVHAQFQLCLVAVSCCHCIGNSRLEPHYIATTHAYAGYGRIFLRYYQRIFYNHINIETKNKNKDI